MCTVGGVDKGGTQSDMGGMDTRQRWHAAATISRALHIPTRKETWPFHMFKEFSGPNGPGRAERHMELCGALKQ